MRKYVRYNFLKYGWDALHATLIKMQRQNPMPYPVGVDSCPEDLGFQNILDSDFARFYIDFYRRQIYPVAYCLGYFPENPEHAEQLGRTIWGKLRSEIRTSDVVLYEEVTARFGLNGFIANFNTYKRCHRRPYLNDFNFRLPASIARDAWQLVLGAALDKPKPDLEMLAWGIALIGWVAAVIQNLTPCESCFRWAAPGRRYCLEHSQIGAARGTGSERYLRYRIGRLVSKLNKTDHGLSGVKFDPFNSDGLKSQILWELLRSNTIAKSRVEVVRAALIKCPHTLEIVGGKAVLSFSSDKLVATLQDKLDPFEVVPESFFLKINMSEKWLEQKHVVAPGKRPLNVNTSRLVVEAIELAKRGSSVTEIAALLKVSKSAVSNWKQRYPDFLSAFDLSDCNFNQIK
jgi:hypothetical protein